MAGKKESIAVASWTRESVLLEENRILQQVMACRTPEAVEAAVSYTRFLKLAGLDAENYPLFLKILEVDNHWVLDRLVGDEDPFLFFSSIPPNRYVVSKAFALLTRWRPGGIYAKTLAIVLGILQNAYLSPRDGYKIYKLSIADLDNLGKHLVQHDGQDDPQNRCILEILERISRLEGLRSDDNIETVARQAMKIRGTFFDNTKMLEDAIPQVLLVRADYTKDEVAPRRIFSS